LDYNLEIQRMTAHKDVGDALQRLLGEAERPWMEADWLLLRQLVETYELALALFAEQYGEDLRTLCAVNEDIARRRGFLCPEVLLEDIREVHATVLSAFAARPSHRTSSLAFARLMQSLSGFAEQWR
jgi:hypothetical protein